MGIRMQIVHANPSIHCGKRFKIYSGQLKGFVIRIIDWWDRISGHSWKSPFGNMACFIYALRRIDDIIPNDDEVLYGEISETGHIVHISELGEELTQNDTEIQKV